MNAIADCFAAGANGPAARAGFDICDPDGSGAVPIGLLVSEKMRQIRKLRKLCTHSRSLSRP